MGLISRFKDYYNLILIVFPSIYYIYTERVCVYIYGDMLDSVLAHLVEALSILHVLDRNC